MMENTDTLNALHMLFNEAKVRLPSNKSSVYRESAETIFDILDVIGCNPKDTLQYVFPVLTHDQAIAAATLKQFHNLLSTFENATIWSCCIAAAEDPIACFVRLTVDFDENDDFAKWLTRPEAAALDLQKVTAWDDDTVAVWQDIFSLLGTWQTVANPDNSKFNLGRHWASYGIEIEVRNQDVLLEKRTPPTTNLHEIKDYLAQVRDYFVPIDGVLCASYWNMHLNISLSEKTLKNAKRYERPLRELAELLSIPANSFERNMYRAKKVDPNDVDNYHNNCKINKDTISTPEREGAGLDLARLEMKNFSISADTDLDYIIMCLSVMRLALEKPEKLLYQKNAIAELFQNEKLISLQTFRAFDQNNESGIRHSRAAFEKASAGFRANVTPLLLKMIGDEAIFQSSVGKSQRLYFHCAI